MTKEYDLVVLGGGTGGYVAAIRASQLGLKTAIVEQQFLGGTCLHKGCIPSKALLKAAEKWRELKQLASYGIEINDMRFDFGKIQARKEQVVQTLHQGVQTLLKKAKIDMYNGFGRVLGPSIFSPVPGTISVEHENEKENTMLSPKYVLIATGSAPNALPSLPFDGEVILNSDDAMSLEALPSSIIIIGGGVIGIEWASLLVDFGVDVTVIEQADTILPQEETFIQNTMEEQLSNRGVHFKTKATFNVDSIHKVDDSVSITLDDATTIKADKMLVSIGRSGNTNHIGLHNTDIDVKNSFIQTNDMYQTKESHIYAIGDCIGGMQLAHVASKEGIIAVEHMANKTPVPLNENNIPRCIYAYPEASSIGMTEQQAIKAGYEIKIGDMPFQSIGKTHVNGELDGKAKVIIDAKQQDILGVHFVGQHATELISEASLAKTLNATAWEISQTIHPHPTISEIYSEAAMAVEKLQIHG